LARPVQRGMAQEATMAHPTGERLRCDDCGAEILFVKACDCPEREGSTHKDICCGKPMRSLGVDKTAAHQAQPGS
jgi:hypothetical protein